MSKPHTLPCPGNQHDVGVGAVSASSMKCRTRDTLGLPVANATEKNSVKSEQAERRKGLKRRRETCKGLKRKNRCRPPMQSITKAFEDISKVHLAC